MVHLFVAEYDDATQVSRSGGLTQEGEDIEVLEVPLAQAIRWMEEGVLRDGRSMLVLQYAILHGIFEPSENQSFALSREEDVL